MAPGRAQRRLTAILAADVAGYSRLMGIDEEGTLASLKAARSLIDLKSKEHRGRIVNTPGDSALVEFVSALDAVRCAVEIQKQMAERNAQIPEDRRIEFRIGINVGDIIVDDQGDIYGDGVNIAARLESLARPGAVCLSNEAYRQVKGKLAIDVSDMGEHQLKNIAQPVRVYSLWLDDAPPIVLPDRPSVTVLPFDNMSGDPKQEYIADGISEDIITELSRFSDLFVIARNSSFHYKGKGVDLRQVGRELGVQYILEGSIRRDGDRVRITAQLIDSTTGAHRWAERYDRGLTDLFAIQDELARTIATILVAHVKKAEVERSILKPPANWQAHDHYLRAAAAWASFQSSWKMGDLSETRRHLRESLSIDPKSARAYSMLSSSHRVAWLNPLNDEYLLPSTLDRAIKLARIAIELNPQLPEAYAELAYNIVRKREFDAAAAAIEKAVALNPNFADYRVALVILLLGEPAKAVEVAKAQMRLDPFYPHLAPLVTGEAYYVLRQYPEAQRWLHEATGHAPNHQSGHAFLAATYAQLGQLEDAHAEVAEVLRLNPKYTIGGTQKQVSSFKRAEDIEHVFAGLRKAGFPE
jgi:adenylate cyclase